jgi:hypothetical protein
VQKREGIAGDPPRQKEVQSRVMSFSLSFITHITVIITGLKATPLTACLLLKTQHFGWV